MVLNRSFCLTASGEAVFDRPARTSSVYIVDIHGVLRSTQLGRNVLHGNKSKSACITLRAGATFALLGHSNCAHFAMLALHGSMRHNTIYNCTRLLVYYKYSSINSALAGNTPRIHQKQANLTAPSSSYKSTENIRCILRGAFFEYCIDSNTSRRSRFTGPTKLTHA